MQSNKQVPLKAKIQTQLDFYDNQKVDAASVLATFGALGLSVGSIGWSAPLTGFLVGLVVGFAVDVLAEAASE